MGKTRPQLPPREPFVTACANFSSLGEFRTFRIMAEAKFRDKLVD